MTPVAVRDLETGDHEPTPGMYLLVGIYSLLFFLGYLFYFWDVAVRWRVS